MSLLFKIAGGLLVVAGLALFWTPIPVGVILIVIGGALIVSHSEGARAWLHRRREKNHRLDRWLNKAETFTPPPFSKILHRTAADNSSRVQVAEKPDGQGVSE